MSSVEATIEAKESNSEKFGRLAFAYCKIATFSLLFGRFALPAAALLSAGFFVAGWVGGKHDTKCFLKYPLAVAAFWSVVLAVWLGFECWPSAMPFWLAWVHR